MRVLTNKTFLRKTFLCDYFADSPSSPYLCKTKLLCALLCENLFEKAAIAYKSSLLSRFYFKLDPFFWFFLFLLLRNASLAERIQLYFLCFYLALWYHIVDRTSNSDIKSLLFLEQFSNYPFVYLLV